ncbi:MAG TPA: diaminopimelate decarboxylase [Solirubrobacteraceae bacterium]|nr:diaminopimelate decarboxylase [Solirubrobacteraceae bacterium]
MATETSTTGGAPTGTTGALTPGLQRVFPLGSRVNEHGHLEIGGCDTLELAREFGTPAYVVAEDDLRARARAFVQAGRDAGHDELHVLFASKAFPCTAVLALFAAEGLWCDVASGGELHLALQAGFAPERIVLHGNAKSPAELRAALRHRIGLIVIDNLDEIDSLQQLIQEGELADRGPQPVLVRATPNVRGETHEKISTGQADSKFGFGMDQVADAVARVRAVDGLALEGVHAHIGSQLFDLEPFRRKVAALGSLVDLVRPAAAATPTWDLGGGLGVAYTAEQRPPAIADYVGALVGAANAQLGEHGRLLIEPGRALVANAGVTLYTVQSVKRNVSTWVAVDGGMSDNLRPMLYGARYEAHVADRLGPGADDAGAGETGHGGDPGRLTPCVLAGKHCESGDVIVRDALLDNPRPGDVIVTPATGAYGYAMANNYNGVPRAPVIFCSGGNARAVVRRETFEDMTARDAG